MHLIKVVLFKSWNMHCKQSLHQEMSNKILRINNLSLITRKASLFKVL